MAAFSYREQQRLAKKFLRSKIQDLERAAELVAQESGRKLAREVKKQMGSFKGNRAVFRKSVKVRTYRARGAKPPATIVRVGVPFLSVFEEGATIRGNPTLIILLPDGERMGFKRPTRKVPWRVIWERLKPQKPKVAKVAGGFVVYVEKNGQKRALYKIQKAPVTMPKKLSFFSTAQQIGAHMDSEIVRLLNE